MSAKYGAHAPSGAITDGGRGSLRPGCLVGVPPQAAQALINCHAFGSLAGESMVMHLRQTAEGVMWENYMRSFTRVWDIAVPEMDNGLWALPGGGHLALLLGALGHARGERDVPRGRGEGPWCSPRAH